MRGKITREKRYFKVKYNFWDYKLVFEKNLISQLGSLGNVVGFWSVLFAKSS
jgi:hypothetical protein